MSFYERPWQKGFAFSRMDSMTSNVLDKLPL
jgi:hypothetical protein